MCLVRRSDVQVTYTRLCELQKVMACQCVKCSYASGSLVSF